MHNTEERYTSVNTKNQTVFQKNLFMIKQLGIIRTGTYQ